MKSIVVHRSWNKVVRDFSLGLVAFLALVALLNVGRERHVPIPLISLFAVSSEATAATLPALGYRTGLGSDDMSRTGLSATGFAEPSAAIVTLLSVLFSSLVAFNMWLVRHLCHVHTGRRHPW